MTRPPAKDILGRVGKIEDVARRERCHKRGCRNPVVECLNLTGPDIWQAGMTICFCRKHDPRKE